MKLNVFKLILAGCLTTVLISCGGESNQKKVTRKIEVTGSADMEFTPNEIYMNFSLREYMDHGKKVKLETIKKEFLATCKKNGIAKDDVSIASIAGNQRWDYYWYSRRRFEPDFMASISYSVKVSSTEKLDKLIAAVNEDAMSNFMITKTSHSDIEKFRKEVKTNAMIASKDKAKYLAKSVGEEIGETLSIQEIEVTNSYGGYYNRYSNLASNSNVSQYSESQQSYDDNPGFKKIKLRYEIKAKYRLK